MINLKILANAVSKFQKNKTSKNQGYPKRLRKKACAAASIYGKSKVAKAIGINQSLIHRWLDNSPSNSSQVQSILKKEIPVVFQEIQRKSIDFLPQKTSTEAPSIRLSSPSGFSMDLFGNYGPETIRIINAFMGGK